MPSRSSTFRLTAPGMWPCRGSHGAPSCRRTRTAWRTSTTVTSPSRARQLLELDVAHTSAATTSSSRATDGRADSSSSQSRHPLGQLDAEPVARAQHPRDEGDSPRRGSSPTGSASSRAASSFGSPRRAGVVVVAEQRVEAEHREPRRSPGGGSAGSSAGDGYRSSRYSMITADSGRTKPSSRIGTRPRRVQLVDPRRPVAQVDLDRLVARAAFSASTSRTRAQYGHAAASYEPHGSSPIVRATASYSSSARRQVGGRRRRAHHRLHHVAVGAGQARDERRVRLQRELVALRQLAVERRHGEVLVDHAAALVEAEAHDAPRARARARRPRRRGGRRGRARSAHCASRSSSKSASLIRDPAARRAARPRRLQPRHELRDRALDRRVVVALDVNRGARRRRPACPRAGRSSSSSGVAIRICDLLEAERDQTLARDRVGRRARRG